jgi:hypothetical protein
LPITLINFSAKQFGGYNEIRWTTSFEQNADKYIIEYSKDGNIFSEAGSVMARNNPSGYSYLFRHNSTDPGKTFYRLLMKDLDGSSRYSSIVVVGDNTRNVRIYSNVLHTNSIELTGNIPLDKINVYNTSGVELYTKNLNGTEGYISIQLPSLAKGIYLVRLQGGDFVKTERILVQ